MRVLIISDTHGRHTGLDRVLEEAGEIDMFIPSQYGRLARW